MSFVVLQVLRHFCSVVNETNKTDTPFYYPTRIRLRIVATGPNILDVAVTISIVSSMALRTPIAASQVEIVRINFSFASLRDFALTGAEPTIVWGNGDKGSTCQPNTYSVVIYS